MFLCLIHFRIGIAEVNINLNADIVLTTNKGPMMLSGNGSLSEGRFQFSGKAFAEVGQEERLANLLNLLGQRRRDGDKDVIALEFK